MPALGSVSRRILNAFTDWSFGSGVRPNLFFTGVLHDLDFQTNHGCLFEVSKKQPIEKIYEAIEEDLAQSIQLGYTPDPADTEGSYHKISLKTKEKDFVVRRAKDITRTSERKFYSASLFGVSRVSRASDASSVGKSICRVLSAQILSQH
jgi:hypothetical protein